MASDGSGGGALDDDDNDDDGAAALAEGTPLRRAPIRTMTT